MADPAESSPTQSNPAQTKKATGISAAALEGARQGEPAGNPDDNTGKLARPAPGMSDPRGDSTAPDAVSSTTTDTGITGGVTENQEDEEQEWRRAGGGSPDQR